MRRCFWFFTVLVLLPWLASVAVAMDPLPAADYVWRYYELPDADGEDRIFFLDLSNQGQIVGMNTHGYGVFRLDTTTDTLIAVTCPQPDLTGFRPEPGALSINRWGIIAATCYERNQDSYAALLQPTAQGTTLLTTFRLPNATTTDVYGVNDWQQFVGTAFDTQTRTRVAYFASHGRHQRFGPAYTTPYALTNWGGIVGVVLIPRPGQVGLRHGFFYYHGHWQQIDVPDATETFIWDMNERGDLVGFYTDAHPGHLQGHSFVRLDGAYFEILPPGPDMRVDVASINNQGQIAGRVMLLGPSSYGLSVMRGFLATPRTDRVPPETQAQVSRSVPSQVAHETPTRPPLRVNLETCDEDAETMVPMKLRQMLGCR